MPDPPEDRYTTLWTEIQDFLASDPKPDQFKTLSHGQIRHSMSMPRYFLDQPLRFDEGAIDRVHHLVRSHRLRLDIREDADGVDQGNFVLFDEGGNYLGRITTKGLTLTPQRFTEGFFRDVLSLYLGP